MSLPARRNDRGQPLANTDWDVMLAQATVLVESGFLPDSIRKPAQAVAIMMTGRELGIPPMAALRSLHIINGKPTASAGLIAGLIQRDHGGEALMPGETTDTVAVYRYKRREWSQYKEHRFTIDDAHQAELTTGRNAVTWKRYPANMLRARCISNIATLAFQDTIMGLYTPEEIGATVRVSASGDVVVDALDTEIRDEVAGVLQAVFVEQTTGEIIDGEIAPEPPPDHEPVIGNDAELITRERAKWIAGLAKKRQRTRDVLSWLGSRKMSELTNAQANDLSFSLSYGTDLPPVDDAVRDELDAIGEELDRLQEL